VTDTRMVGLYLRWMVLGPKRAVADQSGTSVSEDIVFRHWRETIDEILATPAITRTAINIQARVVLALIATGDESKPVFDAARSVLVNLVKLGEWP
jgi:hypothetical protein